MEEDFEVVQEVAEDEKFIFLLNGQSDLEQQLLEFKKACDAHDKHRRKHHKRRYYNLGLMAKIACNTMKEEIRRLLKNGTRTFLIDLSTNKICAVVKMAEMLQEAVAEHQKEEPTTKLVTGLAMQINGDCCRIGRLRNNCSVFLQIGCTMTLTTDSDYKYSGYKEICYAINLKYYLEILHLNDEIKLGNEVRGRVVKKLKSGITLEIFDAGIINSYEYIELPNQCYSLQVKTFPEMFLKDAEIASKLNADFIVLPQIRCYPFLKMIKMHMVKNYKMKLIGSVDLDYVSAKMLDIMGIIQMLDVLWLRNLFILSSAMYAYITQDVLPIVKSFDKPIIGSVPLERCSDFHALKNHEFLFKIDCIFIKKSKWCNKYPLIVKKLLPIKDYRLGVVENTMALRNIQSSYQSIVNFIIRAISSIECQAIFLFTNCEIAAAALGRVEIYCPVYVLIPLENVDEESEEKMHSRIQLTKVLNLRRNLWPVVYTKEMNESEYKPIDFGIEYARQRGCIETGDFVITVEAGKDGGEDGVQLGVGEDFIILRAYYVPPIKVGDKYKC